MYKHKECETQCYIYNNNGTTLASYLSYYFIPYTKKTLPVFRTKIENMFCHRSIEIYELLD